MQTPLPSEKRPEAGLSWIPKSYQRTYLRALAGEASPREAIKAKCCECMGWSERKDVANCTAPRCPLYAYRPYQDSKGTMDKEEAHDSGEVPHAGEQDAHL
jgi:hypothetical protein